MEVDLQRCQQQQQRLLVSCTRRACKRQLRWTPSWSMRLPFWDFPGAPAARSFGVGAATDLLDATSFQGMEKPAAATDLLDAQNSECIEELSGPATIVLGDNSGCAAVESDLHGTFNSRSVFSSNVSGSIVHVEDHGGAASVQGDTGSVASSLPFDSPIRGSDSNSSHHPIHACAHSRLDLCGVGVGLGSCSGALCGVFPCVVDDVDDACMDGPALDGIHVASNSIIQSFTEDHANSCVRLTALQNSLLRIPCVRSGCLLGKSVLFPSSSQESCMKRCGQVYLRSTVR